MLKFLYNITRSSANPEALSLTVKGLIAAVIPIAVMFFHIDVTNAQNLGDAIVQLTFDVATVYATGATVFGLIRKMYNAVWNQPDNV